MRDGVLEALARDGMSIRKPSLFPINPFEARNNYKLLFIIARDGAVVPHVRLEVVDPSHREYLICLHYLKHCARLFADNDEHVEIQDRDNPWDFRLRIGDAPPFSLEITAISDNEHRFTSLRREGRFRSWADQERIPLRELIKLEAMFPNDGVAEAIAAFKEAGAGSDDEVPNAFYTKGPPLFLGNALPSAQTLTENIRAAIGRKAAKRHGGKHETTLIIDNRTCEHDACDFHQAVAELKSEIEAAAFPEIWIYTGYFSDDDSNGAEFGLLPLKTSPERWRRLSRHIERTGIDEQGRLILTGRRSRRSGARHRG